MSGFSHNKHIVVDDRVGGLQDGGEASNACAKPSHDWHNCSLLCHDMQCVAMPCCASHKVSEVYAQNVRMMLSTFTNHNFVQCL